MRVVNDQSSQWKEEGGKEGVIRKEGRVGMKRKEGGREDRKGWDSKEGGREER